MNDEIWIDITYENVKPYYMVSNMGRVKNKITGKILKQQKHYKKGYMGIDLACYDRKSRYFGVHRLVLMMFKPIEGMENLEVNHLNPKRRDDNRLHMLEWCTSSENAKFAFDYGFRYYGEDNQASIRDNETIHNICKLMELQYSVNDIIDELKLKDNIASRSMLKSIRDKSSWTFISGNYDLSKPLKKSKYRKRTKYPKDFLPELFKLISQGYDTEYIKENIHNHCRNKSKLHNLIQDIRLGKVYAKQYQAYLKREKGSTTNNKRKVKAIRL